MVEGIFVGIDPDADENVEGLPVALLLDDLRLEDPELAEALREAERSAERAERQRTKFLLAGSLLALVFVVAPAILVTVGDDL